jgi:hypothetical protein
MHDFLPPALENQGFSVSTEKTENLNGRMRLARVCRRFSVFVIADIRYCFLVDSITDFLSFGNSF